MKIIATVMKGSTARLIANRGSLHDPARAEWIQNFRDRLAAAVNYTGTHERKPLSVHF